MNASRVAAVVFASTTLAICTSTALASQHCNPMTLTSDDTGRSVDYIDTATDGVSKGDMRIGTRRLLDESGEVVGYRRWLSIALDGPAGDGERSEVFSSLVISLSDGQIHLQTLADTSRKIDETQQSLLTPQDTGVVIGGTGEYAFARGSYTSHRDGEKRTYKLDIRCD